MQHNSIPPNPQDPAPETKHRIWASDAYPSREVWLAIVAWRQMGHKIYRAGETRSLLDGKEMSNTKLYRILKGSTEAPKRAP